MTAETTTIRSSRFRVPRSRGALGGALLLVLGAWAGIVAFVGPYMDFAYTPAPDQTWYWTAARGYLEVIPGAAAFAGGLLLLFSASRLATSLGAWLGIASGAWLIVGPPLAKVIGIGLGTPDPASSTNVQSLEQLFFFFAIGAAILLVAAVAAGRLSVHGLRDLRAAERRAAAVVEEPAATSAAAPATTTADPAAPTTVAPAAPTTAVPPTTTTAPTTAPRATPVDEPERERMAYRAQRGEPEPQLGRHDAPPRL